MDMTQAAIGSPGTAQGWRAQLPLRLSRVVRRGERLQQAGWDINVVRRQVDDTWLLAGACAALGARELASALETLHASLATLLSPPHLPQMTMATHLANLHARLAATPVPPALLAQAAATVAVVDEPSHENGYPLRIVPPARYWEHAAASARPVPAAGAAPSRPAPSLAEQFRRALAENRLILVFQPMLSLRDDEDGQFQALLRMPGADGRKYTAAELLPVAAEAGLLAELDRWVLGHCVGLLARSQAEHGARRLFVSQTREGMSDPEAPTRLAGWLAHWQVAGDAIALELRARDAAHAPEVSARYATAMRALGARLALSGFDPADPQAASMAGLPVDFVKLAPPTGTPAATLREHIEALHERGIQVIVPRIENAQEAAQWHAAGADFIQGDFVQAAGRALVFDVTATTL
ncbi:EAL domain-containing protein [Dokdonella sp.]|uniref:EAL domain-containing protein n=1 Tax=Dokdonella sp. TaxID=2291710 RepID=UPI0031CC1CB3|nr:EAL domain-containing protein [Dokdonella sp.]